MSDTGATNCNLSFNRDIWLINTARAPDYITELI